MHMIRYPFVFFIVEMTLHSSIVIQLGPLEDARFRYVHEHKTHDQPQPQTLRIHFSCRALNEDIARPVAVDAQETHCEDLSWRHLGGSYRSFLTVYGIPVPSWRGFSDNRLVCEEHDPWKLLES